MVYQPSSGVNYDYFLWSKDQTQNSKNTFYNLSLFVLVSPIIVNCQNPRCKEAPQINIKLFNGACSQRAMLDPSQLFLCGP